ncbi:MAG: hypothetical protein AAGI52_12455 [Bacteroidota bacterium]
MYRSCLFLAFKLALVGCAPTMYVAHPLPTPPVSEIVVSGEVEAIGRASAEMSVRPTETVSFHGRLFLADSFEPQEPDRSRGGEAGITLQTPLAAPPQNSRTRRPYAEVGATIGRDAMLSQGVRGTTDRYSGHVGLVWKASDRHLGVLTRVTRVSTFGVGESRGEDKSVFVEPFLRGGAQLGPYEFSTQLGLSLDIGDDQLYRYTYVPLILSARLSIPLAR